MERRGPDDRKGWETTETETGAGRGRREGNTHRHACVLKESDMY